MKHIVLLAAALLAACNQGAEEPDTCVFAGQYRFLFQPIVAGCTSASLVLPIYGEDDCISPLEGVTPTGIVFSGVLSCEPGDPVVTCTGYRYTSDGCQHELDVARVAQ